jgi:hypothetical protein
MKIMIENADTLELLTGENGWTKLSTEAKRFPQTDTAFDAAKKEPIGRFNIVGYIPETHQFINLSHGRGRGLPKILLVAQV